MVTRQEMTEVEMRSTQEGSSDGLKKHRVWGGWMSKSELHAPGSEKNVNTNDRKKRKLTDQASLA